VPQTRFAHAFVVLFLCGLTVSLYKLANNAEYPDIVADARSSLTKLRGVHGDVLLAAHGFGLTWKARQRGNGRERPTLSSIPMNWVVI